jgi:hypothetical protein
VRTHRPDATILAPTSSSSPSHGRRTVGAHPPCVWHSHASSRLGLPMRLAGVEIADGPSSSSLSFCVAGVHRHRRDPRGRYSRKPARHRAHHPRARGDHLGAGRHACLRTRRAPRGCGSRSTSVECATGSSECGRHSRTETRAGGGANAKSRRSGDSAARTHDSSASMPPM